MISIAVRSRADFVKIGKDNTCFHSPTILLLARRTNKQYLTNPRTGEVIDFCRVGYTVTKKLCKKAVDRNRIKRRYREAFRLLFKEYAKNHFDYVLLARREAPNADFKTIYNDLKFCFKGVNRLLKNIKTITKK